MKNKLFVLIVNDMVIFPNNEVRIEYDNSYDRQMIEIVDRIEDNLMLIVNPIDNGEINVTSFPKYAVLGRLKLKMSVPNGKTRIVIEGIERVEISSFTEEGNFYRANYDEIVIGSPIWNSKFSCPINTVLNVTDLSNKKISFILYSGSGEAPKALDKINDNYKNAKVVILKEPKKHNEELKKLCEEQKIEYLDMFQELVENGALKDSYTDDGILLNDTGYRRLVKVINRVIEAVEQ